MMLYGMVSEEDGGSLKAALLRHRGHGLGEGWIESKGALVSRVVEDFPHCSLAAVFKGCIHETLMNGTLLNYY